MLGPPRTVIPLLSTSPLVTFPARSICSLIAVPAPSSSWSPPVCEACFESALSAVSLDPRGGAAGSPLLVLLTLVFRRHFRPRPRSCRTGPGRRCSFLGWSPLRFAGAVRPVALRDTFPAGPALGRRLRSPPRVPAGRRGRPLAASGSWFQTCRGRCRIRRNRLPVPPFRFPPRGPTVDAGSLSVLVDAAATATVLRFSTLLSSVLPTCRRALLGRRRTPGRFARRLPGSCRDSLRRTSDAPLPAAPRIVAGPASHPRRCGRCRFALSLVPASIRVSAFDDCGARPSMVPPAVLDQPPPSRSVGAALRLSLRPRFGVADGLRPPGRVSPCCVAAAGALGCRFPARHRVLLREQAASACHPARLASRRVRL